MLRSVRAKPRSHSAATTLATCLLALSLVAASAQSAAASSCSGASARASSASAGKLRSALLCLVNRKRAANGLGSIKLDRRMQRAATRHARDMVRSHYFAHRRPGGPDLTERLRRARWHGSAWGETIAYGCGRAGTPRATVRTWMRSPSHRAILLSSTYRHGGIGVAESAPCGSGAMWVLDLGRR
jgi:uncharacterized protein YkwD